MARWKPSPTTRRAMSTSARAVGMRWDVDADIKSALLVPVVTSPRPRCANSRTRGATRAVGFAALVALHSAGAIHRFSTWRKRVGTWALSGALRSRKPSAILMTESSVMQSGVGDELAVCSDATLPLEFGQDRAWRVCPLRRGRLPPARLTGRGLAASEIDGTRPAARPTFGLAAA